MHWANVDLGARSLSFETTLQESAVAICKETAPAFMKQVMDVYTGTKANADATSNVVKSD